MICTGQGVWGGFYGAQGYLHHLRVRYCLNGGMDQTTCITATGRRRIWLRVGVFCTASKQA